MNFAIAVGVLVEKPIARKEKDLITYYFRLGVLSETNGNSSYIFCTAKGRLGFKIYSNCKEGTPLVVRGAIAYDRQNKTNYVDVSYVEILFNSFDKDVQMGMKEFLEIYKPQNALQEVRKIVKKQEKEEKELCSHTESMSDM